MSEAQEKPSPTAAENAVTTSDQEQKESNLKNYFVHGVTAVLALCCIVVFSGFGENALGVAIGIGPKFALILATSFFALASIFGLMGALIFFVFGPAHLVQWRQILKATAVLEGKRKTNREIEFMQGQKIYSAWKPTLVLLFARLYYDFGGNETVLGWVFIISLLYMIAIMGIDAGRIILVAVPIGVLFMGYFIWNEIDRAGAFNEFWAAINSIIFDSGMAYIPLASDIVVGFVICLILVSLCYHKFFDLNFGFYRNQYTVGIFIRRSRSFPREQMVLDNDVPDAFEDLLDKMSTVLYMGVQSGIDNHFFYCVPFGNQVHALISRATSRQQVVEG